MSKGKKNAVIIATLLIVVGIIVTVVAMALIRFDFTKLNTMKFETKTYEVQDSFANIDIHGVECDIRLVPATDNRCKIVCSDSKKIVHNVSVDDNTLKVSRNDTRRWYERIGVLWDNDLTVTVYLPKAEYENLYIKTVSSDIEVPSGFAFKKAELFDTSGDVLFIGTADELTVKSVSGDIKVGKSTNGIVGVESTSGDISVSNMTADALTAATTSGEIELSSVFANGRAALKAVSGDVELDNCDAESFEIKTVSGSVTGSLMSDKNFVTHTTSGDVRIPQSDSSAGVCEITTSSGDIDLKVLSSK